MADKVLVIRLDEETYAAVCKGQCFGKLYLNTLRKICDAIKSATPLPKGHGRLIDISKYENNYFNVSITYDDGNRIHKIYTSEIPTIIEADGIEVWNGIHAQITAPKGTFEKIWNEADKEDKE